MKATNSERDCQGFECGQFLFSPTVTAIKRWQEEYEKFQP